MIFGLLALITLLLTTSGFIYISLSSSKTPSIKNDVKPIGFWRRQFQLETTASQKKFDWIFGVILPVICFTFDPVVFKSDGGSGEGIIGAIKPFACLLSFVSIMAMMAWLIWGAKLEWFGALLSGFFAIGGLISLMIGIVLFPFSLIGLIVLIGALGFTPLFTSIVYLRNAVRAYHSAQPFFVGRQLMATTVLSAMFGFVVPFTINMEINGLLDEMINGDVATIQRNAKILKFVAPITNFERLGRNSYVADSPGKLNALSEAYRELTGEEMSDDWRIIN